MHRFLEKYADSIEDKDALKLIVNKLDEAYHLCKHNKKDYIEALNEVMEMIKDFKSIKGH